MISNGTIPNDGCSTDGPSSPKGTVPWVQLFGGTSQLFLTIWCLAYVLLSLDILEEHLALGWGPFFFTLLKKYWACTNLEDAFEAQGKVIFHAKRFLAMKGFKITVFQGFSVLKISIPVPWISSPTPVTAFGLCTLLTGQFHKNLFSCCKVSLGNLCLTVQFLLPTSTKWVRRAACGTMLKTMSQEHLGKKRNFWRLWVLFWKGVWVFKG